MRSAWRVGLSALALALLLAHIDRAQLGLRIRHADLALLGWAFLSLLGSAVAGGLVWASVFPPEHPLRPAEGVRLTLIGFSINNLVPTGVAGDVYRAWAVARRDGWSLACYSVLMDRWCAFLVLLGGLAAGALYLAAVWPGGGADPRWALAGLVGLLALGFAAATVLLLVWGGRLPPVLRASLRGGERFLPEICARMRAFLGCRRSLVTFAWAAVSMGLEGLSILCVARALGAAGDGLAFMAMAPVFRVMHRVPGFVNAIGPQEAAALGVWSGLGQTMEMSLSISFLLHAVRVGVGLLGVPLYLLDDTVSSEELP